MGVRLPAEYQEVEWIGDAINQVGSPYILTDYYSGNSPSAEFKFEILNLASGDKSVFGWLGDGSEQGFYFDLFGYNHAVYAGVVNKRYRNRPNSLGVGIHEVKLNADILNINGTDYASTDNGAENSPIKLAIFAVTYRSDSIIRWNEHNKSIRIYYLKIFNDGVLGAEFIPCYRKSDSEPGMYDLVSKTFYTNQGTGEFLVGPDVVNHISPRLMDRRRALIAKLTSLFRKVITSQTGLVSFDTNVAKPMKVTCEFSPKQDLHGYDAPWPAGGGTNKLNVANASHNSYNIGNIPNTLQPSTTYTFSIKGTGEFSYRLYLGNSSDSIRGITPLNANYISADGSQSFTTPDNMAEYNILVLAGSASGAGNVDIDTLKPVVSLGSTAPSAWTPYSNICPISGWTGANIPHTGKNLLDLSNLSLITCYLSSGGTITEQVRRGKRIDLPPGTYTFSGNSKTGMTGYLYYDVMNADGSVSAFDYWIGGIAKVSNKTLTLTAGKYVLLFDQQAKTESDTNKFDYYNLQLEVGSTASAFEEYHGTILPIPFNNPGTYDFLPIQTGTGDPSPENVRPITPGLTLTRDDNTTLEVWGGSLTVNADGTGSLVSNMGSKNASFLSSFSQSIADDSVYFEGEINPYVPTSTANKTLCNLLKYASNTIFGYAISYNLTDMSRKYYMRLPKTAEIEALNTLEKLRTYLNNYGVQFIYYLSTPVTYTLSVTETNRALEALGLTQHIGPLYGGTVTINKDGSCDVVVDNGIGNFDPTKIAAIDTNGGVRTGVRTARSGYSFGEEFSYNDHIASDYIFDSLVSRDGYTQGLGIRIMNYTVYLTMLNEILDSSLSDADYIAAAIEYFTEHPVTGVLPLATTQTYHFDNVGQLQSFLGTNNVWSDLNGPITVEYYKKQQ